MASVLLEKGVSVAPIWIVVIVVCAYLVMACGAYVFWRLIHDLMQDPRKKTTRGHVMLVELICLLWPLAIVGAGLIALGSLHQSRRVIISPSVPPPH